MAQFQEFTDTDVHLRQVSQTTHSCDIPSSSADESVKVTHPGCQVVPWQVRDLKPHSSHVQLGIKIPASRLNELIELGEDAFIFPLFITSTGIVIDGYARVEVARLQGRETVMCVEFDIPEKEALRRLILCHRRATGLLPGQACATSGEISQRKGTSASAGWWQEQEFVKIDGSSKD